jgi:glutamate racemase
VTPAAIPTIGVFDSGFGGLTVLRALIERMPLARFAFLGDTARLPYGSKSRRTIARYAVQSAQFLVEQQGAEFLVIACNTASALALDAIQQAVPVPVLGVIDPGAQAARAASHSGDVLVIATDATVQSHAYTAACRAQSLRALEKACPLLVPLVEEGWTSHPVTEQVVRIYLDELSADAASQGLKPDALVLGCTHYPLLRPLIQRVAPAGITVIDSAESTADAALRLFNGRAGQIQTAEKLDTRQVSCQGTTSVVPQDTQKEHGALAPAGAPSMPRSLRHGWEDSQSQTTETEIHCFATDSVEKFQRLGSRFLGRPVGPVELIDLGG